jgi:signal transduction histidine kinase
MSHELRTPMNGVMGMIDLVLMRATDPKQIDMLNKSKGAAQRMINVINDILDFSKADAERLPLEEKNFSLSQMIDDVVAMQDLTAEAKGLTLIREIPVTFPDQLSGDAFRLRQILLNFLGNACKFSDQGMITVRVSAVEQDGESVLTRIEVEDQGIGINPEQQAMLFQAFTQVDGSMTRKYGGSGLGLIISKRLANLMGGDVGVVSQEGHGSTFWATVRLKPAKAGEVGI